MRYHLVMGDLPEKKMIQSIIQNLTFFGQKITDWFTLPAADVRETGHGGQR